MEVNGVTVVLIALLLVCVFAALFLLVRKRKPKGARAAEDEPPAAEATPDQQIALPERIAIAENPALPLVTIEESKSDFEYRNAIPLNVQSNSVSRLGALFQAAPSLFVKQEAAGKHLMEVVINGDLVRAADGNGYRPYVMSAGRIKEQARLF